MSSVMDGLQVSDDAHVAAAAEHASRVLQAFISCARGGAKPAGSLLFDDDGVQARCMVDLDTLARMPVPVELGDALRSWCNPRREDDALARFELPLFAAAVRGYASAARGFLSADEVSAIVPATLEIHLELAARFLVDALEESYFGWDATRYDRRACVRDICASRSKINVDTLVSRAATFPNAQVAVVLPTPPLKLIVAMVFIDFFLRYGYVNAKSSAQRADERR